MREDKGILGRLLLSMGAVLVIVGVFVFQGLSRAEETETSGGSGSVGVSVPTIESDDASSEVVNNRLMVKYYTAKTTEEIEAEEAAEAIETSETQGDNSSSSEAQSNSETSTIEKEIEKYYKAFDVQTYVGEESEHVFEILSSRPESELDFLGWYEYGKETVGSYLKVGDELTVNTGEPTIYLIAKFGKNETYGVRYNANGGMGAPGAESCESYFGSCDLTVSSAVPFRDGHEFRGWAIDGDSSRMYAPGTTITLTNSAEPTTLYALWAEVKTYTLMYDVNGGSGVLEIQDCRSASGSCDFVVSSVTPTKQSAEFVGWLKGGTPVEPGTVITATQTSTILVAEWRQISKFTLSYVSEGEAKELPESQSCESAMGTCTFILSDKEPVRDGYKFLGWRFEDKEDMLAHAGDEIVVGLDNPLELKMKAVWSKIYTLLNSGEVFGAGERVVLRSSAGNGKFKGMSIDGEEVPEGYFALGESNTTSIMLSNAYSQSLRIGEHGFVVTWEDGEASGVISVNQSEDGTKRFLVVDAAGTTDGSGLMYRPKAGAVSKESTGTTTDAATDNNESSFDAVRTLVIVAVGAFIVVYIVNKFYVKKHFDFLEEFR